MGAVVNKATRADAIDSASLAHGFAIICASEAPLLPRIWRRSLKKKGWSEMSVRMPQGGGKQKCMQQQDAPLADGWIVPFVTVAKAAI